VHGGTGWLEYDKVFCQQAGIDESAMHATPCWCGRWVGGGWKTL